MCVEQRESNGQPIEQNKKENNNSGFNENHNLYSIFLASKRANEKQAEDNRTSNEDKHHQEVKSDKNPRKGDSEESNIRENKKWPTDKAYFIAKELLMTERTYKKDLDVVNVWLRDEISKEPTEEGEAIVSLIELLADVHAPYLQEIEARIARWERNARHSIGDFLYYTLVNVLPLYDQYLENLIPTLEKVEYFTRTSKHFDQICRDFESQKYCYLPLTSFLLKPLQRLLHYNSILKTLLAYYPKDHTDFADCLAAQERLGETLQEGVTIVNQALNLAQLCELQRDISGFENLVQEGRRFLRQGCMQKYSKKGFQQRMFFLFSDVLLYAYRSQQPTQCFRVQGQLPVKGMKIAGSIYTNTENELAFDIHSQENQLLTVAASSLDEHEKWLEELTQAIVQINSTDNKLPYLDLKSCHVNTADDSFEAGNDADRTSCGGAKASQRINTAVYVCWHRNTSISYNDLRRAFENQLSGFLLRKFKNSNGWQKLWVVFTNFCLFFYKSHQDDYPLASLPLLGYAVSTPSEKDGINKDFVFKLQFKSHVYFFRAESDYTFGRWMEVIKSANQSNNLYSGMNEC